MSNSTGNKAYIKVIVKLQRLFAEKYKDGGWLPGGRKMAAQLGVTYPTYWKAINCLVAESFVKNYPGKGFYVYPDNERCHKIGIVLKDGATSPYYEACDNMIKSMQYIRNQDFNIHLIQGTHPKQLHENAIAHGVDGLLWLKPSSLSVPYIQEINTEGELPLVVAHWGNPEQDYQGCCISYDSDKLRSREIEFIRQRGHRKVFVLDQGQESFESTLSEDKSLEFHYYHNVKITPEQLIEDYKRIKPTMLVCGGGPRYYKAVCQHLEPIVDEPVEMLLQIAEEDIKHLSPVPFVKLFLRVDTNNLHTIAAEKLIKFIKTQEKPADIKAENAAFIEYSKQQSGIN